MRERITGPVVFCSPGLSDKMGGAAISEASLVAHLQKKVPVTLLCEASRTELAFIHRFGIKRFSFYHPYEAFFAWLYPKHPLNSLIRSASVFHLNGHWRWENYFFLEICRRWEVPYVLHPRGMFWVGHRKIFLKKLFNLLLGRRMVEKADKIIALSQFETRQFGPYGDLGGRTQIIPNGIDLPPAFSRAPKGYFLYLGRLESRKNLLFLIEAFARYRSRFPERRLLLMGPVERDYDRTLRGEIDRLGLSEIVQIFDPVYGVEKFRWMAESRAVIYPSVEEPFGRVPFEAISVGALPIVPAASGAADYLRSFLPQALYQDREATSLENAFYYADTGGWEQDLDRAREWVANQLSWESISDRVLECYEGILRSRATNRVSLSHSGEPKRVWSSQ